MLHARVFTLATLSLAACGELPYFPLPGGAAGAIAPGDLVLHELMISPLGCPGASGQYIELVNTTDRDLDLQGLILSNGAERTTLTGGVVPAGGFAWGAPDGSVGCYPSEPDFTWQDLVLGHDDNARVAIANAAGALDAVPTEGWAGGEGRAWALRADQVSAAGNDRASAWCLSDDPIAGSDDFGSPGGPNVSCATSAPDDSDDPGVITRSLASLSPGDLVITELFHSPADCDLGTAQYVEVYNPTRDIIDLTGLILGNGDVAVPLPLAPDLAPGAYAYLAVGDPAQSCFAAAMQPDGAYPGSLLFRPGDQVLIGAGDPLVTFDSADLGDLPWTIGVALQLSATRLTAADNDLPGSWCDATARIVPGETVYDLGTPGAANEPCVSVPIVPQRTGAQLVAGDLVITEIMTDPLGCDDHEAEYIEIFNRTGVDIDLQGLSLWIGDQQTRLTTPLPVAAGAWALAEIAGGSSYVASCYVGLRNDLTWNTGPIADEGVRVELRNDVGTIDVVDFTGELSFAGRSLQLDPTTVDATSNDSFENWCLSLARFPNSRGDYGTPRAPNRSCTPPDTDTDLGFPVLEVSDLQVGDLIITELLPDPIDCSDFAAEYIEIYNTTDAIIRLDNLIVTVNGQSDPLWFVRDLLFPDSHGLLVYRTGGTPGCYGAFDIGRYNSERMNDTNPDIAISAGSLQLDRVNATGWSLVVPGEAITLDPDSYDPALNDQISRWCLTDTIFPGALSDQGSPGVRNAPCPAVPVDTDESDPPDSPTDSPTDTDDTFQSVHTDPPIDTDEPPPVVVNAASLAAGDLVITEFMADPTDCNDFQGEYIEFFNTTDFQIDPLGLQVRVGTQTLAVSTVQPIAPRSYAIARYSTGGVPTCASHAYVTDVLYASARMDSGGSLLALVNPTTVIDQVPAAGWGVVTAGASAILNPALLDAVSNDQPTAWCTATTLLPGATFDRGSPRAANLDAGCFP